jgi:phospholipase C
MSRRAFVAASAAAAAAAGISGGSSLLDSPAAQAEPPAGLTYSIHDLKHVVVLMKENRSFDHYYGMLPGARGFADKQQLQFPNGRDVFHQPSAMRPEGYLLPFHMDSAKVNAMSGWDLNHGWPSYHMMWDHGAYDQWIPAKTELSMGYYTDDEIPWHYAAAQAWTVADHYHCSIMSATMPNRMYNWSGYVQQAHAYDNNLPGLGLPDTATPWRNSAEFLVDAGVEFKSYDSNYPKANLFWGQGSNMFQSFKIFKSWAMSGNPELEARTKAAGLTIDRNGNVSVPKPQGPPAGSDPMNMSIPLENFIADCANNTLPPVSWMAQPGAWEEHPGFGDRGAHFNDRVIEALASNPEVWNSTLLIINYDEADGVFDHVPPPVPEPGEPGEFFDFYPANGFPAGHIGPGPRVPTLLISPWTRGGHAYSGVLDHTGWQLFVEYWLKETKGVTVRNTNITPWRRKVLDNLFHALDFENPDFSVPDLPDTKPLLDHYDLDLTLPPVAPPPAGQHQEMPVPAVKSGRGVTPKPAPYMQHATITVDRDAGTVTATMTNDGGLGESGVSMGVYPDDHKPFRTTPYTVMPGTPRTHVWDATETGGRFAMSIYGPDRFIRSFAGTVVPSDQGLAGVPSVTAEMVLGATPTLKITLANDGLQPLQFTLAPHDYEGTEQDLFLEGGQSQTMAWPTDEFGFYDVIVTDSSDTGFRHRYAGRIQPNTV